MGIWTAFPITVLLVATPFVSCFLVSCIAEWVLHNPDTILAKIIIKLKPVFYIILSLSLVYGGICFGAGFR
jgi:hypothetical protein